MRRKLLLITLALIAGALVALAALPWWLGGALALGGERFGLSFGEYRRIGYTRFALTDVEVRRPGVDVSASRVELSTPLAWLKARPGEVAVAGWSVVVTETAAASPPDKKPAQGWRPLRDRLDTVFTALGRWLPPTTAGAGDITWPGGALHIAGADWRDRTLQVSALTWRDHTADIKVTHRSKASGGRLVVQARTADDGTEVTLESEGPRLSARAQWWGQPLTLTARFDDVGWIPLEANVEAVDWRLPAARAGLESFYEAILGRATLTWRERRLVVDVQAEGTPIKASGAPPLVVRLQGAGGPDQLSIDRLEVRVPGVDGRLTERVVFGRDGRLLSGPSRFYLAADLTKQPWFEGSGHVDGVVKVIPQGDGVPTVSATLSSDGAAVAGWTATKGVVEATLQWPVVRVSTATVQLAGGDHLMLGGEWNLRTRTLAAGRVQGRVSRATVSRWLTRDLDFEAVNVDLTAEGAWPMLNHQGRVNAASLSLPPLRPLMVDLEWQGAGDRLDSVAIDAVAGGTRLHARGTGVETGSARLDQCVLTQAGEERLRLVQPMRLQWAPSLAVGGFQLSGPQGKVAGQLAWGETGEVKVEVENFESTWLNELVALPGPGWSLSALALDGRWDRGPLEFTAKGNGVVNLDRGQRAGLSLDVHGTPQGVQIEMVRASMERQLVAKATGSLPVTFHPKQAPLLRVDEAGALAFEAVTEPNAFFWGQVAALTGLVITDPAVRVSLTGTVEKPIGQATMRIARIAPEAKGNLRTWPEIEDLDLRLTADRSGVKLETLTVKAAGQAVRASGRLPVRQWTALLKDPLALAKTDGEARIEIPDAAVAALARHAPAYLAPTGTLQVDVSLRPGGQLYGVIRLKEAATRPLGPLGILQSVGAEIVLNGRTVEFKEVRASMGGQPVTLTGTVALSDDRQPRLDLALRGEKLPFVRQAGLLVRGDLDLRIVTGTDGITRITGETRFGDSLFLMDVRALLPSGGARNGPGRRPPYFTVQVPPFDEWQLDVAVEGDRFLRLRTPVFNGLASAQFRLRGTLRDPRATGEAVVNQGQVVLPFATFGVRQGEVRLTEANPFEPGISLIGTSRRYGYDLRMEVSGTVEQPVLTFSSTPPLESEQVLLMVMAGETPQNEVSYSGRQRAARLGAYLGRSLLGQLGGDPTAEERLTVTVGERVSRQGRETYGVEYELNPRWSLVGEYDEFDDYNLGVKWRVLSEKKDKEAEDARK